MTFLFADVISILHCLKKFKRIELSNQATMTKETMRAVIFKKPYEVAVEERPVPKITDQTDVIVRVTYSALCGR